MELKIEYKSTRDEARGDFSGFQPLEFPTPCIGTFQGLKQFRAI